MKEYIIFWGKSLKVKNSLSQNQIVGENHNFTKAEINVLVSSVAEIQYPSNSNRRETGYFGSQFRVQLTMAGESSQQDTEEAGHITSTVQSREWVDMCVLLFYTVKDPSQGMVSSMGGDLTPVSLLNIIPHWPAQGSRI